MIDRTDTTYLGEDPGLSRPMSDINIQIGIFSHPVPNGDHLMEIPSV